MSNPKKKRSVTVVEKGLLTMATRIKTDLTKWYDALFGKTYSSLSTQLSFLTCGKPGPKEQAIGEAIDRMHAAPFELDCSFSAPGEFKFAHGLGKAPRMVTLAGVKVKNPDGPVIIKGWDETNVTVVGEAGAIAWLHLYE